MKKFIFIVFIFFSVVISQTEDSVINVSSPKNRFELRLVGSSSIFEIEASRLFFDYVSADVVLSPVNSGVRGGISFYPVSFLFFQGSIGTLQYRDVAMDGPSFEADYVYAFRGGARVPLGKLPLAIAIGLGRLTMVQNDYNPNGGFVMADYVRKPNRKEARGYSLISLGLTLKF